MKLEDWKKKNKNARCYAHFDEKISLTDDVWNYISNPQNIKKHGFYPFIRYQIIFKKYKKENGIGIVKEKTRDLCYSAHIDRYIYSYYGYLLNQKYNEYLQKHNMNMVAVAYRNNLKMNNIHFAKLAFDFIKNSKHCFIMIGDFSNFFDSLEHNYLKNQICNILGVDRLPDDYYAVFKNITKYSILELTDLLNKNNLRNTASDVKKFNSKRRALTNEEFKKYKSKYIKKHNQCYGIPQGSAISAVLANIYMIEADEKINQLIQQYYGLYMRYSDDFIVVIPEVSQETFNNIYHIIDNIIHSIPNLKLQPDKTQIYQYNKTKLVSCNCLFLKDIPNKKNEIDYLGFTFNGNEVSIRDKTISKYYYRMYKKAKAIVKSGGYTKKKNKISCKHLYAKYSIKGAYAKDCKQGNFLTYIRRAQNIFKSEPINRKTKKHMLKIRRVLNKISVK